MIVWKLAFSISFFFIFKLSEIIGCQDAHIFQENLSPPGKIYIFWMEPHITTFWKKERAKRRSN